MAGLLGRYLATAKLRECNPIMAAVFLRASSVDSPLIRDVTYVAGPMIAEDLRKDGFIPAIEKAPPKAKSLTKSFVLCCAFLYDSSF